MKTQSKVGDKVTIWRSIPRPNGERVHPASEYSGQCASRWKNADGTIPACRCRGAEYEEVEDQMVIEQIMWFADNSTEAHGYAVSDGMKWHVMLEAPRGDACF